VVSRPSDRDRKGDIDDPAIDPAAIDVTSEVGGEGGSPGSVEVVSDSGPGAGSEHDEIWQPTDNDQRIIARDEAGTGRKSP
jgi:hypothetical protein